MGQGQGHLSMIHVVPSDLQPMDCAFVALSFSFLPWNMNTRSLMSLSVSYLSGPLCLCMSTL